METKSIFNDRRLDKEYQHMVSEISSAGSGVINRFCSDPAVKKAAYRFVNNEKVTLKAIVGDLITQAVENIRATGAKDVLVAQDTMEVVRQSVLSRLKKSGKTVLESLHSKPGMRSHSAIIMNADNGLPLGFGALEIWGREPKPLAEVKEENFRPDRKRQPSYYIPDPDTGKPRYKYNIPVMERDSESARWIKAPMGIRAAVPEDVHITMVQDREGDMYPLLTLPSELPNFDIVVRASKKRKVLLPKNTKMDLFEYTASTKVMDKYEISVGKSQRKKARKAEVELRYGAIEVLRPHSPVYPQKSVSLYFIRVTETPKSAPANVESVDWLLLTSIKIEALEDARNIVKYYRNRWFIEDFHRLLKKKGFGIEDIQVESPHAFEINLALCIKSAYEVALVKRGFDDQDETAPDTIAFTPLELEIVSNLNKHFNPEKKIHKNPYQKGSLAWAAWAVACEGGWSAMPSQPKPGVITFKRGIDRIETIYQYLLEQHICG